VRGLSFFNPILCFDDVGSRQSLEPKNKKAKKKAKTNKINKENTLLLLSKTSS
jgi:hypothetical protein